MYDHPPSLSSPPYPSSSAAPSVKMTRSNSPIPHISTLLPHHHHHSHHHSHSQYSPNSRAADISRLLDPSYASHNSSSSSSSARSASQPAQTRAYVDHHGDLHDPDYRDFPVLPARSKSNTPRRRHTASSAQLLSHHHSASRLASSPASTRQQHQQQAQHQQQDRYSTYPLVARPEWERDWATEVEDVDEGEEEQVMDLNSPFVRSSSIHTTPSSRRASLPPSIYAHSSFFYNEPVSMTSSPVDSLEEQEEAGLGLSTSPFEDLGAEELVMMETEETSSTSKGRAGSILRRIKRNGSQASVSPVESVQLPPPQPAQQPVWQQLQQEMKEEHEVELEPEATPQPAHYHIPTIDLEEDIVPTCTYAIRRQLRAVTLRLRFGMFHVRRRLVKPRRKTI